jgi:lysozyme
MNILIPNARKVALRSHSMWAIYLGIVALWTPDLLYLWLGYDVASPRFWMVIAQILLTYGAIGRLINQGLAK